MKLRVNYVLIFLFFLSISLTGSAENEKSVLDLLNEVKVEDSLLLENKKDNKAQLAEFEVLLDRKMNVDEDIEYKEFVKNHHKRTFTWQYYATIMIFITVMLIVYSGLILSFIHFKNDLKTKQKTENEIEVGSSGIKLRSSVIGLIILTLSLAFFYLYLTHAFEIEFI